MPTSADRFTRTHPCPICGGGEKEQRGEGQRCYGYVDSTGSYARCTRPEQAGGLEQNEDGTYSHRLGGRCRCGQEHSAAEGQAVNGNHSSTKRPFATWEALVRWYTTSGGLGRLSVSYEYLDESGELLFRVLRFEPKTFRQARPTEGGWLPNLLNTRRVLYRLPELIQNPNRIVFVTEGEKDADRLWSEGLVATTAPGGAGKWSSEYSDQLRGRALVLLCDNDDEGRAHVEKVAAVCGEASWLKVIELPGLPAKGDVSDWLDGGHTADELRQLVVQSQEWAAVEAEVQPAPEANQLWPGEPAAEAFHGLGGEIVRSLEPYSEADPIAILGQLLALFGVMVGSKPHFMVGPERHSARLYVAIVGRTAVARKGTAWSAARLVPLATNLSIEKRIFSGLASGEALIHEVRDQMEGWNRHKQCMEIVDVGVEDKRMLVMEPELARVLRTMMREGNSTSAVLRDAWDRDYLQVTAKTAGERSTGAHIGMIGHITAEELRRDLTDVEVANGFGNRLLWLAAKRSKLLPEPELVPTDLVDVLSAKMEVNWRKAIVIGAMRRSEGASKLWRSMYHELSEERAGLTGALLARSTAQLLRLSMLYALIDGQVVIGVEHLMAAKAVWDYATRSVFYLFGLGLGGVAERLAKELRSAGILARTEISQRLGGKIATDRITAGLETLAELGLVRQLAGRQHRSGETGRVPEVWEWLSDKV